MPDFKYEIAPDLRPRLGLVALQSDETIELDFRRLFSTDTALYVSRVPSDPEVTSDSLRKMAQSLTGAAALFPQPVNFDVVGYGCTSGTSQIGASEIARLVQNGTKTNHVSEPVSGLIAACEALGVKKLGFLSPYIEEVSTHLRRVLDDAGIESPVFESFNESREERVAHIDGRSIIAAAKELAIGADIEALFLSCTNLRTLDVIADIEDAIGIPVLSSNQVLAWHMARLSGATLNAGPFGKIWNF